MNKDIWLHLVSFLDDMDVIYLRRTCTYLRKIIPQRKIKLLELMNKMNEGQYLEEFTFPIFVRMADVMFMQTSISLVYYFMTQSNKNTVLVFDKYGDRLLSIIYQILYQIELPLDTRYDTIIIVYLNIIKLQFTTRCILKNHTEVICKFLYSDNKDILNLTLQLLILMLTNKDIQLKVRRRRD